VAFVQVRLFEVEDLREPGDRKGVAEGRRRLPHPGYISEVYGYLSCLQVEHEALDGLIEDLVPDYVCGSEGRMPGEEDLLFGSEDASFRSV
jgi:hypothetical protein